MFRSVAGWAFGFSVTVLLIALWGRAVVVDTDALTESLSHMADSRVLREVLSVWVEDEFADTGYPPQLLKPAVKLSLDASATVAAMEEFLDDVVKAAASSDPAGSTVDVAALLTPAVPEVTAGLSQSGVPADSADVAEVVASFDPMVIRQPGAPSYVGPESPAATRLGTAAMLAMIGMVVFGYGSAIASEDRIAAVRSLFSRVAVGGLGFSILLLIGSWIIDPDGGRAPILETISAIASSKWLLPLQIGLVAAVAAGLIYFGRRILRRMAVSRLADGVPEQPDEQRLTKSS